jgi:predicted transcriptional regulator of viral defense system
MDDMPARPDHAYLFDLASGQHGYFTARQAARAGFNREALRHHAATGRFTRIRRGLYRLRDYPSTPYEDLMAALLGLSPEAVISHDSALALLGLGTVIPNSIHVTVPRNRRYARHGPDIAIHTTSHPVTQADRTEREGIPVTTPARTIIDVAATDIAADQVEMAVEQALGRALTTREELEAQARDRNTRVQQAIARALVRAGAT